MSIKLVPDVAAPLTVTVVDLVAKTYSGGKYVEWADYIMTAGGLVAAFMNKGGDFVKNIGVSSLPLSAERLYDRIKAATGTPAAAARPSSRLSNYKVSRYPAPSFDQEFSNVRLD